MTRQSLKTCFAILSLSLSVSSCGHGGGGVMPALDIKLYAGSPARGGIERAQDNEVLTCTDPRFNQYACLSYADLRKIYATLQRCESWGSSPMMSARTFYRQNKDVVRNAR